MVIGLEEPILVKGIGELLAKIDSGNSGYNVIHGEDFVIQGNILNFKTVNKNGDERRVSKKIKETLRVNIGGGHIQERPVIEMDVKFGGEDYKKVLFSVTDRSDNEHKVLISKDFVGKELDALIDVTKDNISDDNINVEYVGEGFMDTVKNAASTLATGAEWQHNLANKMSNFNKAMHGEQIAPTKKAKGPNNKKIEEEVGALKHIGELIENDKVLIINQLNTQVDKFPADFEAPMDQEVQTTDKKGRPIVNKESNVNVQKLLDYMGNTNIGSASSNPDYLKRMKEVLAAYKKLQSKPESEETVVSEAASPSPNPAPNPAPGGTPNPAPGNRKKPPVDPTKDIQGTQIERKVGNLTKEELNKELSKLQNRNRTVFYIVSFNTDIDGNQLTTGPSLTSGVQNIIDSWSVKLVQEEKWTKNAFTPFVKQLVGSIDKNAKGLFAICSGPMEGRNVEFFTNPGLFYTPTSTDKLVAKYDDLNVKFQQLSGEELTDENLANYMANIPNP